MNAMNLEEFEDSLDRWGCDLENWPESIAEPARGLLEQSRTAQALLEHAQDLDALLADLPEHHAAAGLKTRIISDLPADPWQPFRDFLRGSLWRPALVASLPLLAGFAVGLSHGYQEPDPTTAEMSILALSISYEDFENGQ